MGFQQTFTTISADLSKTKFMLTSIQTDVVMLGILFFHLKGLSELDHGYG